jgi:hypothetical protein
MAVFRRVGGNWKSGIRDLGQQSSRRGVMVRLLFESMRIETGLISVSRVGPQMRFGCKMTPVCHLVRRQQQRHREREKRSAS